MPRIIANASALRRRTTDIYSTTTTTTTTTTKTTLNDSTNDDDNNNRLTFTDLALPSHIVDGLLKCGFVHPSPVQIRAIPIERLGRDVMVQAKSGTGKTVAFACKLLDTCLLSREEKQTMIDDDADAAIKTTTTTTTTTTHSSSSSQSSVKAMCIAPTREIALQTADVLRTLAIACANSSRGKYRQERLACFFGGLPVADDGRAMKKRPACVVGTPGRLKQLVEMDILRTDQIRTVVLDEADQLLTKSGFCGDVLFLIHAANHKKRQLIACSATFSKNARKRIESLTTKDGKASAIEKVNLCEETVALQGVKMCYRLLRNKVVAEKEEKITTLPSESAIAEAAAAGLEEGRVDDVEMHLLEEKAEKCLDIFNSVRFHQAIIFVESRDRGEKLSAIMTKKGGFKTAFTSGRLPQRERMDVMQRFRDFELRAIVSTDLISRGVDCERVNLVVNVDLPRDGQTFMHRCGRTGRFGTSGVAIAILEDEIELKTLKDMLEKTSKEEQRDNLYSANEDDEEEIEKKEGERKNNDDDEVNNNNNNDNNNNNKSNRLAAFCNLEELPENVPESWYAYELEENDEEKRRALQIEEERLALESSSSSSISSTSSSEESDIEEIEEEDEDDYDDDDEDFEEVQRYWREHRAYASWWWWHEYRQKVGQIFLPPQYSDKKTKPFVLPPF
jgi:ATP-dependent RNA helicase DDX20